MFYRETLLNQLAQHAYQYNPDSPFLLSSGVHSNEYFDCKLALSLPDVMDILGKVVLPYIDFHSVAVGGLTMGSDPLAMSVSQYSTRVDRNLRWFSVRKQTKGHGQKKMIEGAISPGQKVTIVDDVVTSGESTIQAMRACNDFGLQVIGVVILIDREELNGMSAIKDFNPNIKVKSIFKKSEIHRAWTELNVR